MRTRIITFVAIALLLFMSWPAVAGQTYEALFTSPAAVGTAGVAPPSSYEFIYNGGVSSGGLDQGTNFGLKSDPDYTGWNVDHTGVGNYHDPSLGWTYNNNDNNGGYTDAYSTTETLDSGYIEFEWTFNNVLVDPLGYQLTVTVDDLDDYVTKKGQDWASVPDDWRLYVNGNYIGSLYDYDDPQGTGPDRSINTFNVGDVSGVVKIEIDGIYFDLLHEDDYYGISYGTFASWGDTASAQHGIRLEGLELSTIPAPGAFLLGSLGVGFVSWMRRRRVL